jgi:hypothetical protein
MGAFHGSWYIWNKLVYSTYHLKSTWNIIQLKEHVTLEKYLKCNVTKDTHPTVNLAVCCVLKWFVHHHNLVYFYSVYWVIHKCNILSKVGALGLWLISDALTGITWLISAHHLTMLNWVCLLVLIVWNWNGTDMPPCNVWRVFLMTVVQWKVQLIMDVCITTLCDWICEI